MKSTKVVINVILGLCVVGLLYICVGSIMGPIHFQDEKAKREAAVIKRMRSIRDAEEWFKQMHEDQYCDSFPELIAFVKNSKVFIVNKQGSLTDDQMEKGLTEASAAAIVRSGNAAAIAAHGLQGFRRDTIWVSLLDSIFGHGFNPDSIQYIPYSNGKKFELEKFNYYNSKAETSMWLMECRAPYDTYLQGLDPREIANLKHDADKASKYPGLKFGDISSPNNNAGNWE
jgi:hypothetical protein